jgi:hypothetical protein
MCRLFEWDWIELLTAWLAEDHGGSVLPRLVADLEGVIDLLVRWCGPRHTSLLASCPERQEL